MYWLTKSLTSLFRFLEISLRAWRRQQKMRKIIIAMKISATANTYFHMLWVQGLTSKLQPYGYVSKLSQIISNISRASRLPLQVILFTTMPGQSKTPDFRLSSSFFWSILLLRVCFYSPVASSLQVVLKKLLYTQLLMASASIPTAFIDQYEQSSISSRSHSSSYLSTYFHHSFGYLFIIISYFNCCFMMILPNPSIMYPQNPVLTQKFLLLKQSVSGQSEQQFVGWQTDSLTELNQSYLISLYDLNKDQGPELVRLHPQGYVRHWFFECFKADHQRYILLFIYYKVGNDLPNFVADQDSWYFYLGAFTVVHHYDRSRVFKILIIRNYCQLSSLLLRVQGFFSKCTISTGRENNFINTSLSLDVKILIFTILQEGTQVNSSRNGSAKRDIAIVGNGVGNAGRVAGLKFGFEVGWGLDDKFGVDAPGEDSEECQIVLQFHGVIDYNIYLSINYLQQNGIGIFILQYRSLDMKTFDINQLKKTAKVKDFDPLRSYSDLQKSPLKSSSNIHDYFSYDSCYLSRWGKDIEGKVDKNSPWVNVGQGIFSVAVGDEHILILNNKNECFAYGSNSYGQLSSENPNVARPTPITSFKDMKITAVYSSGFHSFVQNQKGQIFAFGLNLKGQLGVGNFQNRKKPTLIYSLLPNGSKNPRSSFFIETSEYRRKSKKSRDEGSELGNITNLFQKYDIPLEQDEKSPNFLLFPEQSVIKMACGPLHTAALTNKNRLFTCGYGEKFCLGTGKAQTLNQFVEVKLKNSFKIEKIQAGVSSLGYIASGKAFICGAFGERTIENFSQLTVNEEIVDLKLGQKSAIFLTKKGDVYQLGEIYKENGQKIFSQIPKKLQKLSNIKQIFGAINSFFAISQNKAFYGWGDNQFGQIAGTTSQLFISSPQSLKIPLYLSENLNLIVGNGMTFLLSSKPLQTEYDKFISPSSNDQKEKDSNEERQRMPRKGGSSSKLALTNLCGTEQKQMLDQLGVQPRMFNCNMEIDFTELVFQNQISEGGYGIIYKGLWRETIVAIKMFKIESEGAVKDFFSECAAMEALRHPNIVMFLGACTKPPNFAIVLEYCARGSLWSTIQNLDINLSWEDRRKFALDTARGVNYLHTCSPPIIHRDLKSLNLLLDDSYKVKLADFGWTKGLQNYMTGKIGTYQWMAPEVIASQKYSQKADVFSYGIILWEISSRQPPFKHLTGLQVSIEVLNNDMRPTIPKKTPEVFAKLMKKCWDRDPSKRPSFKQIIKELQAMKF